MATIKYYVDVKQWGKSWVRFEFEYSSQRKEFLKALCDNQREVDIKIFEAQIS